MMKLAQISRTIIGLLLLGVVACGSAETAVPTVEPLIILAPTDVVKATTVPASPTPLPATVTPTPESSPTSVPTVTSEPAVASVTPQPEPTTDPIAETKLSRYHIAVTLDYEQRTAEIVQTVDYVNLTGRRLDDILFVVEPHRLSDVFVLHWLQVGEVAEAADYLLDNGRLQVTLSRPLPATESIQITFAYTLRIPEQPRPFGVSGGQLNLGDWYPMIPPYRPDQGWIVAEPANVGEHVSYDTADFLVDLSVLGGRTDLELAASGAISSMAEGQYRISAKQARNMTLVLSPDLLVERETVAGVEVASYFLASEQEAGRDALYATVDALLIYNDLFGPYPHDTLSVVSANLVDGREFDGLVFVDRDLYTAYRGQANSYLIAITVHEVAHQWWYGAVGNDQAVEPWLDEALATYSELLFYETRYPEVVLWWWETRVERFSSDRSVGNSIYGRFDFNSYVSTVYLRGAKFLHELRAQIGTEAFLTTLKLYRQEHQGEVATAEQFFATLQTYTEQDLSTLRRKYFTE